VELPCTISSLVEVLDAVCSAYISILHGAQSGSCLTCFSV
jgi:hypothetical protein